MDIKTLKDMVDEYWAIVRILQKSKDQSGYISLSSDCGNRTLMCSTELKVAVNNLLEQRVAKILHELSGIGMKVESSSSLIPLPAGE